MYKMYLKFMNFELKKKDFQYLLIKKYHFKKQIKVNLYILVQYEKIMKDF